MKALQLLFFSTASLFLSLQGFAFEIDSTEDSSIDFIGMEATLSSKIIHFQWDVNAEQSGDYFVIEKSTDQQTWIQLTRIESIANHKERHTYSVSEINLVEAENEFFRISRVDVYGQTKVLDKININQPVLGNMILIPIQGKVLEEIRLSYDSLILSKGEVTVSNEAGEIQFKTSIHSEKGYNHFLLNIKDYPAGRYLIVIKDEFGNKTSRALTVHEKGRKGRRS